MEPVLAPIPDSQTLAEHLEMFLLARRGDTSYYALPPELNYLAAIPEDPVIPYPPEFHFTAAFDSKGLAARVAMVPLPHIEGTWLREDLRGTPKVRTIFTLIKELEKNILATGRGHAFSFVHDEQPEVAEMMTRLGYEKYPLTIWVKDLNKEK